MLLEEQERREKEALRERLLKDVGPVTTNRFYFCKTTEALYYDILCFDSDCLLKAIHYCHVRMPSLQTKAEMAEQISSVFFCDYNIYILYLYICYIYFILYMFFPYASPSGMAEGSADIILHYILIHYIILYYFALYYTHI